MSFTASSFLLIFPSTRTSAQSSTTPKTSQPDHHRLPHPSSPPQPPLAVVHGRSSAVARMASPAARAPTPARVAHKVRTPAATTTTNATTTTTTGSTPKGHLSCLPLLRKSWLKRGRSLPFPPKTASPRSSPPDHRAALPTTCFLSSSSSPSVPRRLQSGRCACLRRSSTGRA